MLRFSEEHSIALKISPIVCAANTFDTLVRFAYELTRSRRLINAAKVVGDYRHFTAHDCGTSSFASLRENTSFRVLLFFLGALPQLIKISSLSGALLVQICATCYTASFVVDEMMLTLAPCSSTQPSTQPSRRDFFEVWIFPKGHILEDILSIAAVSSSIIISYCAFSYGMHHLVMTYLNINIFWPLPIVTLLGAAISLIMGESPMIATFFGCKLVNQ